MKKLTNLALVLSAALLLVSCSKDDGPCENRTSESRWGKPLAMVQYDDAKGTRVESTTLYSYDILGRLLGYQRISSNGGLREEMLNSVYEGNTHTYEVHSYEWIGGSLPVIFFHTDTYTNNTFTDLEKQVQVGKTMDFKETITYEYENGKLIGYQTVQEGTYPGESITDVVYEQGIPAEKSFPAGVEGKYPLYEIFYMDKTGNRTGYYNGNDYGRTEWNFTYTGDGCTFYRKRLSDQITLVRVIFYPEKS